MADTGFVLVGTGANDAAFGSEAWINPTRVTADDNSDATNSMSPGGGSTNYLKGTNLGLAIPAGSTIDGIEVRFEWWSSTGGENCTLTRCRMVKADGTIGTTDRSDGGVVPGSRTLKTLGGSTDLWGETWAEADVEDIDFGFVMAINKTFSTVIEDLEVDAMWVKVYYTEAAAGSAKSLMLLGVGR